VPPLPAGCAIGQRLVDPRYVPKEGVVQGRSDTLLPRIRKQNPSVGGFADARSKQMSGLCYRLDLISDESVGQSGAGANVTWCDLRVFGPLYTMFGRCGTPMDGKQL
jgi:hypothetical protein